MIEVAECKGTIYALFGQEDGKAIQSVQFDFDKAKALISNDRAYILGDLTIEMEEVNTEDDNY